MQYFNSFSKPVQVCNLKSQYQSYSHAQKVFNKIKNECDATNPTNYIVENYANPDVEKYDEEEGKPLNNYTSTKH